MKLDINKVNKMMREVELRAAKAKRELKQFQRWVKRLNEDDRSELREAGLELQLELRQARADRRRMRALYE